MTPGRARWALVLTALVAVVATGVVLALVLSGTGGSRTPAPQTTVSASADPTALVAPALFGPAPAAAASRPPDTSLGMPRRARYVSFRDDVMSATAVGRTVALDFFDDAEFVGTVARIDRQELLTSWSGPLNTPRSDFVVTLAGGRYQVTATTGQGVFTMSMTRAGLYQIVQVGQQLPIDSGPAQP